MGKFSTAEIYRNLSPFMFVNMKKTALFFETNQKLTVHLKRKNTILIKNAESNYFRMTACVASASNAVKQPLFLIFKVQPGDLIELSLLSMLPPKTFGCCQAKG